MKYKNNILRFCFLGFFFGGQTANAQLYGDIDGETTVSFDLCTCTTGSQVPNQGFSGASLAVSYNGNIYATIGPDVYYYSVATGTNVFLATMPGETSGLVYGSNGLLYTVITPYSGGDPQLISIDPITGAIVILGEIPQWTLIGDLFFYQGALYGWFYTFGGSPAFLAQLDINNPINSTVLFSDPEWDTQYSSISAVIDGVETVFVTALNVVTSEFGIYQFNMNTGAYTPVCPNVYFFDLGAPPGYILPSCCNNDAGNFASSAPLSACANQTIAATHLGDETLTAGSSLSFVLATSPTGPFPASVIQSSATPEFAFNPALMNTNTTYYIVAVAAPGPPGAPNWSATCRDISAAVPVQWQPLPTLQVVGSPAPACANACAQVTINFTGAFPITLDWQLTINSQVITGSWTADNSTETFSICPETGQSFPVGNLNLSFLQLADGVCVCN